MHQMGLCSTRDNHLILMQVQLITVDTMHHTIEQIFLHPQPQIILSVSASQ